MGKIDLNNTVVEAKNEGDGKIILDFFKDNDIRDLKSLVFPTGFRYSHDGYGNQKIYYGIIDGELSFFVEGEPQDYENVKILEMVDGDVFPWLAISPVEEKTFPRKMLVWDDDKSKASEENIIVYADGQLFPWISDLNEGSYKYFGYKNAEEIEIPEFTMEQLVEKMGNFKLIK